VGAARSLQPAARVRILLVAFLSVTACTIEVDSTFEDEDATEGSSITEIHALTGCNGRADNAIPADGRYTITTFGGPGDHQPMSCGGYADGTWYYAASRQRYGCGSHVEIRANGNCVVAQTDDYGPDVCVERAAHMPIIDVSPAVARALFGTSSFGWSDHVTVTVTEVPASTPLGRCSDAPTPPAASSCSSATLARDVAEGTCVQAAGDGAWYRCSGGAWVARGSSTCTTSYAWCASATLGEDVPPRTCVQSASSSLWYQCNGQGWVRPVDTGAGSGPLGACSSMHGL
jgi:hypothetical protein